MLIDISYADGARRYLRTTPNAHFGVYMRKGTITEEGVEPENVCSLETDGDISGSLVPGGQASFEVICQAIDSEQHAEMAKTGRTVKVIVTPDSAHFETGYFTVESEEDEHA